MVVGWLAGDFMVDLRVIPVNAEVEVADGVWVLSDVHVNVRIS